MGYNVDLYGNLTQATYSTNGLIIVGLLVQVSHSIFNIFTCKYISEAVCVSSNDSKGKCNYLNIIFLFTFLVHVSMFSSNTVNKTVSNTKTHIQ